MLTAGGLLDGLADPASGVVDLDPATVRPSLAVRDLVDRWRSGHLTAPRVVVTTAEGRPLGVLTKERLLTMARLDQLP